MSTVERLLDDVRRLVGDADFRDNRHRWLDAANTDRRALELALADLRRRLSRGPVRCAGSWLMVAWKKQSEHLEGATR